MTRQRIKPADELPRFKAYLTRNGGEVLQPTNIYELLRFRTSSGVGIIYVNSAGRWNPNDVALNILQQFRQGIDVRLAPHPSGGKRSSKTKQLIRACIERDGPECFFCAAVLDLHTATLEHLCPVTAGGPHHIANSAIACGHCNAAAGHLSVVEKVRMRERLRAERQSAAPAMPEIPMLPPCADGGFPEVRHG